MLTSILLSLYNLNFPAHTHIHLRPFLSHLFMRLSLLAFYSITADFQVSELQFNSPLLSELTVRFYKSQEGQAKFPNLQCFSKTFQKACFMCFIAIQVY